MSPVDPRIAGLGRHPFARLVALLADHRPPPGLQPVDLSIGEPKLAPPGHLIAEGIAAHAGDWGRYPPNDGPEWFRETAAAWLERRFALPPGTVRRDAVLPTAGAREALFQVGLLVDRRDVRRRQLALPTPHYAPYRAAALLTGLSPLYLAAVPERGYLPDLDVVERHGRELAALIVCSPTNPEGASASSGYLSRAVALARRHGFVLVVDECYSDVHLGVAPTGVLRACLDVPAPADDPFAGVLAIHSLSKRSSAAGLRVAMVSGDRRLVAGFVALRAYCGGTTPLPNLAAATRLLVDEDHVDRARQSYRATFGAADRVLAGVPGYRLPEAGMFLWLRVEDDEAAAIAAWCRAAVRVVPGSYLGPPGWDGAHRGARHVRVAMVYSARATAAALRRLAPVLRELGRDPESAVEAA